MNRRNLAAALACLLLVGCGAAPQPEPTPPPVASSTHTPDDAVLLASLGFQFAPEDFYVPGNSVISERVDQVNNIVAVFTAPSGLDLAGFLRSNLPQQGWTITEDGNNSLLFERGELRGAFTVTGALAALTLRSDDRS